MSDEQPASKTLDYASPKPQTGASKGVVTTATIAALIVIVGVNALLLNAARDWLALPVALIVGPVVINGALAFLGVLSTFPLFRLSRGARLGSYVTVAVVLPVAFMGIDLVAVLSLDH